MKPRQVIIALSLALTATALEDQFKRPPGERDWHGTIGPLPYDFRVPTPERIRHAVWNPDNASILVPHVFGLGWIINFHALTRLRSKS